MIKMVNSVVYVLPQLKKKAHSKIYGVMQIEFSHMRVLSLVSRRRASSSDKLQKAISGQRDTGGIIGGNQVLH